MSFTTILDKKGNNKEESKTLVKTLASWSWEWRGITLMKPSATLSRTKWQSISICLVLLRKKKRLKARWMTTWLSQNKSIGTWKFFSNWRSQTNSLVVETKAFTEDRETVVWFLAFQETKELPIKMQKPVTHFLVSKQEPQSAFGRKEKALTRSGLKVAQKMINNLQVE